jgi:hypothetical protein
MARTYDPLTHIPSPEVLRAKLAETERLAERLRTLLDVSERIHAPVEAAGAGAVVCREAASVLSRKSGF